MKKQQYMMFSVFAIGLYLVATGISYGVSTLITKIPQKQKELPKLSTPVSKGPQTHFTIDPSTPKTEECPLNGMKYTKQEKDVWVKRRPLTVMIENHQEARPQSGLSYADIIYEAVAEGGVARFMGVFYCGISNVNLSLAPVRSTRTYFLPWVLEYDALYNHVGGAGNCPDDTVDDRAKALCQIDQYRIKDMDQFGISFPTCYRNYDRLDHPVATEHTMVCQTDKLYDLAATRGWTNVDSKGVAWDKKFEAWKFKDDAKESDRGTTASITFAAWKSMAQDYSVTWLYDKTSNAYKRENGGKPHTDLENDQQLTAKAVVILFAKETGPVDDHMHLLYANTGNGSGLVFQDGAVMKVTWQKQDRNARTTFYDSTGKEIRFNRGQLWIEMLPVGTDVVY